MNIKINCCYRIFQMLLFLYFDSKPIIAIKSTAPIISLEKAKKYLTNFKYTKIHEQIELSFPLFPLISPNNPFYQSKEIIPESFIAEFKGATVYSEKGLILSENQLIDEFLWPYGDLKTNKSTLEIPRTKPQKIRGRVAIITQEFFHVYYHWMTEFLPKLALLQENKIDYDYLYIPSYNLKNLNYMKETLELIGIDKNKIIHADKDTYIEPDLLVIPSFRPQALISPPWVIHYLRNLFIPAAYEKIKNKNFLSKRVFISRKKSQRRKILNEDDIFNLLINKGFKRYFLEDLSILEQALLFNNAEIIVASHGASLINLIFSKPNTHVIEIFQTLKEECYWRLSHMLQLNHVCIKTTEFKDDAWEHDTMIDDISIERIINVVKEIMSK